PKSTDREDAIVGLTRGGQHSVAPLITALADPARAAEHAEVRAMLFRLRADAIEPLIAAIESGDAKLQAIAVPMLADLRAKQAVPAMVAALATPATEPAVKDAINSALKTLIGGTLTVAQQRRLLERVALDELHHAEVFADQDTFGDEPRTI